MYYIKGRVGGLANGLDVDLQLDGDQLTGRIGGDKAGSDVQLLVKAGHASGRIGGARHGFDVHATVLPDGVKARLGGLVGGDNLELSIDDGVHGRFSGAMLGKDVKLELHGNIITGASLRGRIGGDVDGKDVFVTSNAPTGLAALAAVIAFKLLEDGVVQS